jgi:hypothetical protein
MVPDAKSAMNTMKHEIAGELGINLKQGYNGDLTSRQAGYIGGYMVKRMIDQQKLHDAFLCGNGTLGVRLDFHAWRDRCGAGW